MAILLAFAIVSQALAMGHQDTEHSVSVHFETVICADGEVKTLSVNADGEPLDHQHHDTHCPFCIPGNIFYLSELKTTTTVLGAARTIRFSEEHSAAKVADLRPDCVHCLGPPRA